MFFKKGNCTDFQFLLELNRAGIMVAKLKDTKEHVKAELLFPVMTSTSSQRC